MGYLISAILVVALCGSLAYALHLKVRLGDLQSSNNDLRTKLLARQGNGGMTRSRPGTRPEMQRAITTTRDSDDLPRAGRVVRLSTVRRGGYREREG